jgi:hypothetical protein
MISGDKKRRATDLTLAANSELTSALRYALQTGLPKSI